MESMLFAPLTVLFHLKSTFEGLLVFEAVIVGALAHRAFQLNKIILGHSSILFMRIFLPTAWSRWSDSNRRPSLYKSVALPTELHRRPALGKL